MIIRFTQLTVFCSNTWLALTVLFNVSLAETLISLLHASPAGALHCGRENGVSNLQEYAKELEKLYKDKNYRNEKLKREQSVQESLSYKNLIPKLMEHIETAKKIYFENHISHVNGL